MEVSETWPKCSEHGRELAKSVRELAKSVRE